jgi:hypothetical protein
MATKTLSRRELMKFLAALGIAVPAAAAGAQGTQGSPAAGGKVIFDNDKLRVIQHAAKPRMGACGTGYHTHPPHLTICLTDIKAKVTLQGKEPFIAENKAGDVFWDPGGYHNVENLGSRDTRTYLVELKS